MTTTFTRTETMVTTECCDCGITFGMPADYNRQRQNDRRRFFCPNGHGQSYCGETEESKLKRQVQQLQQRNDQLDAAAKDIRKQRDKVESSLRATRGVVTRLKNRTAKGLCPCCNEEFHDLKKHMEATHTDFEENEPFVEA